MKRQKKVLVPALVAIAVLACGTLTAFAATDTLNIGISREDESSIILGKDAEKEPDGIAKVSFDLGKTWLNHDEAMPSDNSEIEYWAYAEYQTYAETVEQDFLEMLNNGEPGVTQEDIQSWQEEAAQVLELIKAGGKVAKNTAGEDCQLMVSALDSSIVGTTSEK